MNNLTYFSNSLESLPYQTIEVILQNLLNQENSIEIVDALFNIPNFNVIKCLVSLQNKKSLCLMNTRIWILVLYSMGYNGRTNTFSSNRRNGKAERIKKEANLKCPIVIKSSVFY